MSENQEIELRSEKVRNIIGQIPSRIVRMGITVIFVALMALLAGAYLFRFDYVIDIPAKLYPENNNTYYTLDIPQNKIRHLKTEQKLVITVHNENSFTTTIQHIDTIMRVNQKHSYFGVRGILDNDKIKVDVPTKAQAKIYIGKTNSIDFILNR